MVRWLKQSSWPAPRAALERMKALLRDARPSELRRLPAPGARHLPLAGRCDGMRLNGYGSVGGVLARARLDEQCEEAFRGAGLGQVYDAPEIVAARIKASHIENALVPALDHWSECTPNPGRKDWALEVARKADSTGWLVRARNPEIWKDDVALAKLIATAPIADQSVALLLALGRHLSPTHP